MSYSYYLTSKWTKGEEVEKSIRKTNNDNVKHPQHPQHLHQLQH